MSDQEPVEVQFHLQRLDDKWPPISVEALWCTPVFDGAEGTFHVVNVPIYAVGVSYGDLISTKRTDGGPLEFDRVLQSSGHSTLRVLFADASSMERVVALAERLGAAVHRTYVPLLVALDVPVDCDCGALMVALDAEEDAGVLEWEEGRVADGHQRRH